jgi:hypoxanthine phosphoribosyltransferase
MTHSRAEAQTMPLSRVRVLIDQETIARRVAEMGDQLARDYVGKRPILIAVLKGAAIFVADLVRAMDIDLEMDFLSLTSYGTGMTSSGKVHLVHDLRDNIQGRDVILVEGVVDTGLSVSFLLDLLAERHPRSLKVCTLLDKVPCRKNPVPLDYVGFRIGDEFVIGYGMDAAETYRQLPFVGVVEANPSGEEHGE